MKKIASIALIITFTIALAACGGGGGEQRTFVLENDDSLIKLEYTFDNDIVTDQISYNKLTYDTLGFTDKNEAEEALASTVEQYEDLEGVTYDITFKKDKVIEETKVDYESIDFDEAQDVPGFEFSGDLSNGISMEETAKMLEENGFTEE